MVECNKVVVTLFLISCWTIVKIPGHLQTQYTAGDIRSRIRGSAAVPHLPKLTRVDIKIFPTRTILLVFKNFCNKFHHKKTLIKLNDNFTVTEKTSLEYNCTASTSRNLEAFGSFY